MRTETCSIEPKFDDRSPLIRVGAAAVVLDRVADATRDEFMTKSFEGSSIDGAVVLSCTVNVAEPVMEYEWARRRSVPDVN